MSALGAILIIVGFILGVYVGIKFSLRNVMVDERGDIVQGKQMQISLLGSLAVLMTLFGVILFF